MTYNIPTKKLKNGFEMPVLGIGTWKMWGTTTRDPSNDDARDIAAIKYAIDQGLTCIDNAEMYAGWYSETLQWQAMKWYDREKLFLSTKVRGSNCSYEATKRACYNSLKRLWVDSVDLYYIHWREPQFDLAETMRALCELVDEWYIKYIGVSNFSKETLAEAQSHSRYPIVANQVHYNLICRECETSWLLEYCQKNDVMLVAWRPLEYGEFQVPESKEMLEQFSEKYNRTSYQIALNWVISEPNVVTLFKSSTPKNIDENLWCLWWALEKEDREYLKQNFPYKIHTSNAVPLG